MEKMVPCVISTNTTLGTMDDISVSSEPEWFSSLTKHSFVWMASFLISQSDPSVLLYITCETQPTAAPRAGVSAGECVLLVQEQLPGTLPCCAGTGALLFAWRQCQPMSPFPESLQLPAAPAAQSQLGSASLGSSKRSSLHKAMMFCPLNYHAWKFTWKRN